MNFMSLIIPQDYIMREVVLLHEKLNSREKLNCHEKLFLQRQFKAIKVILVHYSFYHDNNKE